MLRYVKAATRRGFIAGALVLGACTSPPPAPALSHPRAPIPVASAISSPVSAFAYPATRRTDDKDIYHDVTVPDPYRWLEAGDEPEVKSWAHAQDAFARARLKDLPSRGELAARLRELMYAGDARVPERRGNRYFYQRRDSGKEKHTLYVREVRGGAERALVDPNRWPAEPSLTLQAYWPSLDGRKIAYLLSKNNADAATVHVVDVDTGRESAIDTVEPVRFNVSWSADSRGFYYRQEAADPSIPSGERNGHGTIRYHRMGTDPKSDPVVRPATGDARILEDVIASRDGRWLFLKTQISYTQTDWQFRDARRPGAPWIPITVGRKFQYKVLDDKGVFYVKTDDGAPRGRVFRVDPAHPQRENWKVVVEARNDATLEGWRLAGGKLFLQWSKDVAAELEIRNLDGTGSLPVELPGLVSAAPLWGSPENDEAFVRLSSYTLPPTVFSVSMREGVIHPWSKIDLPGVDPSRYEIQRIFSVSKDGARVPMLVVHRRDIPLDGRAPVILYGYGGFQFPILPQWIPRNFAWVERGGIYVESALRGGTEYGEEWHRAGMLTNKQHTFDDLIGAAEELIRRGWARPEHLAVAGGSNGGLTVASVITQRPELFRAALAWVPVIDVIRSPLFGNGKLWEREYGAAEDPEQFRAMYAYSPLHHIEPGRRYPALLVVGADSDDRLDPMHARKFAAAMQAAGSDRPVLLKVLHDSGHFGAGAAGAAANDDADADAFLFSELGSVLPTSAP